MDSYREERVIEGPVADLAAIAQAPGQLAAGRRLGVAGKAADIDRVHPSAIQLRYPHWPAFRLDWCYTKLSVCIVAPGQDCALGGQGHGVLAAAIDLHDLADGRTRNVDEDLERQHVDRGRLSVAQLVELVVAPREDLAVGAERQAE